MVWEFYRLGEESQHCGNRNTYVRTLVWPYGSYGVLISGGGGADAEALLLF